VPDSSPKRIRVQLVESVAGASTSLGMNANTTNYYVGLKVNGETWASISWTSILWQAIPLRWTPLASLQSTSSVSTSHRQHISTVVPVIRIKRLIWTWVTKRITMWGRKWETGIFACGWINRRFSQSTVCSSIRCRAFWDAARLSNISEDYNCASYNYMPTSTPTWTLTPRQPGCCQR